MSKLFRRPQFVLWLSLLLGLIFSGCGGTGGLVTTSPSSPGPTTGALEVRQVLQRSLPAGITHQRFRGTNDADLLLYGPETREKAPTILLQGVSPQVTRLLIEYFEEDTLVGFGSVAVVVRAGETTVVDNPPFDDVGSVIQSLSLQPAETTIAKGTAQRFQAVARNAAGSTFDVSSTVQWSSSNLEVAAVDLQGLASGLGVGQTIITARLNHHSADARLTVSDAVPVALSVSPSEIEFPLGLSGSLQAELELSDGSTQDVTNTAQWSSADPAVATVASGIVQGVAPGSSQVSVEAFGFQRSALVTVADPALTQLSIHPQEAMSAPGSSRQYRVEGRYTDGSVADLTAQATWTSTLDEVTFVTSPSGRAQLSTDAVTGSSATINATFEGLSGQATLHVQRFAFAGPYGFPAELAQYTTSATGELTFVRAIPLTDRAGPLVMHPNGMFLYSVSLLGTSRLTSIALAGDGTPTQLGAIDAGSLCENLVITPDGRFLFVSTNGEGLKRFRVEADGSVVDEGVAASGVDNNVWIHPSGRFLFVPAGLDLVTLAIDEQGGLTETSRRQLQNPLLTLVVHPSGSPLYASSFNNGIDRYSVGSEGELTWVGFDAAEYAQFLAVDPLGRFVYNAQFVQNVVQCFAIGVDGSLSETDTFLNIEGPRPMAPDPTGQFFLIGGVTNLGSAQASAFGLLSLNAPAPLQTRASGVALTP